MRRREFIAQLAAGVACAGLFLPGRSCAEYANIGIVPVGKRGRVLADELVGILASTSQARVGVIDATAPLKFEGQLDGVVVFGCLGGLTGMNDATACGRIARWSTGGATAVLLWPMDFEGHRRRAAAHLAAGRIHAHGVEVNSVRVEVPRQITLNEARELRERALLARGIQEVERFCS